jgi:predicted transcriptional regulator of viral defense system
MEHTLNTMTLSPQHHQTLALARQQGILRPRDLQDAGIPRVVLTRLAASGLLVKQGRGLYQLQDAPFSEYESLCQVARRVPQAAFCLITALQIHELTTQMPREIWIAMPRGSHTPRLDYPPIRMIQFTGDAYSEGIEIIQCDQINLRVYNIAKTLVDCFKHRNKIGLDVALEALKEARAQNKLAMDDIWHHAKIARVANIMRPYLESL